MVMNAKIKSLSKEAKEMLFVLGNIAELQKAGLIKVLSTDTFMTREGKLMYKALIKTGFSISQERLIELVPAVLKECEVDFVFL